MSHQERGKSRNACKGNEGLVRRMNHHAKLAKSLANQINAGKASCDIEDKKYCKAKNAYDLASCAEHAEKNSQQMNQKDAEQCKKSHNQVCREDDLKKKSEQCKRAELDKQRSNAKKACSSKDQKALRNCNNNNKKRRRFHVRKFFEKKWEEDVCNSANEKECLKDERSCAKNVQNHAKEEKECASKGRQVLSKEHEAKNVCDEAVKKECEQRNCKKYRAEESQDCKKKRQGVCKEAGNRKAKDCANKFYNNRNQECCANKNEDCKNDAKKACYLKNADNCFGKSNRKNKCNKVCDNSNDSGDCFQSGCQKNTFCFS